MTGSVLFEGDFSCIAEALKAAVSKNANLSYADLRSANLRYADLSYASLSYANLRSANLSYASLSYADLSYADLRYANLRSANLSSANLSYANLSYADLSYADLRYVMDALPVLKNPDALILAAIGDGKCSLEMATWHTCDTTHCRAGWYIHHSGPAGRMLEACYGASAAGAIIFTKAYPDQKVPDFHCGNDEALASIKENAERASKEATK